MGQRAAAGCACADAALRRKCLGAESRYEPERPAAVTLKALNGDVLGEATSASIAISAPAPKSRRRLSYCRSSPAIASRAARRCRCLQRCRSLTKTKACRSFSCPSTLRRTRSRSPRRLQRERREVPGSIRSFQHRRQRFFVSKLPNCYLANGDGKVVMATLATTTTYPSASSMKSANDWRAHKRAHPRGHRQASRTECWRPEVVTVKGDGSAPEPGAVEPAVAADPAADTATATR